MTNRLADTDWDTIVVGAGPAGSLAALRLARGGARVLLVDKASFPRPKVCGGCLGAVGLAALAESGLSPDSLGVATLPLRRVAIHSAGRMATLPLGERRAIDRAEFDDRLLDAAREAGVTVATNTSARLEGIREDRRLVRLSSGNGDSFVARCRVTLVAAGLAGRGLLPVEERPAVVASRSRRIGVGATLRGAMGGQQEDSVFMLCGSAGYLGVAPLPGGRLDVAAALNPGALRDGIDGVGRIAASVFEDAGLDPPNELATAAWRATPQLTQRPARLGVERVLLLGDAAGYVEPFTGEGIGWALRSAIEVEPIAKAAIRSWDDRMVETWGHTHRVAIGSLQKRCRLVCGLIGARWATPMVVGALSLAPWLGRPVMRRIDPIAPPAA